MYARFVTTTISHSLFYCIDEVKRSQRSENVSKELNNNKVNKLISAINWNVLTQQKTNANDICMDITTMFAEIYEKSSKSKNGYTKCYTKI